MSTSEADSRDFINSLPYETLYHIFEIFAEAHDDEIRQNRDALSPATPSMRTLHAVALTSKKFRQVSRPLLHRTVFLTEGPQCVAFLQRMIDEPKLGSWIRNLFFIAREGQYQLPNPFIFRCRRRTPPRNSGKPLLWKLAQKQQDEPSVLTDAKRLWNAVQQTRPRIASQADELAPDARDSVVALLTILMRLPNLRFLRHVGSDFHTWFAEILARVVPCISHETVPSVREFSSKIEIFYSSGLSLLWFTVSLDTHLKDFSADAQLSMAPLTTLPPAITPYTNPLSKIKDLRLTGPLTKSDTLLSLFNGIKSLEILHYDVSQSRLTTLKDLCTFLEAISPHKPSLVELRITAKHLFSYDPVQFDNLPPLDTPCSLAEYPNLTVLQIPGIFFCSASRPPVKSILPPDVKNLVLGCCTAVHDARAVVGTMMSVLIEIDQHMPRLKIDIA
ncbi:hypothetical protein BJX61DRAFT_541558 [Aspergillus egyptiacus]|nr:hypothetical protein BJX61DRAFT_541558 [Aspergillus egyptiacus]